jgi:hypothetical protein
MISKGRFGFELLSGAKAVYDRLTRMHGDKVADAGLARANNRNCKLARYSNCKCKRARKFRKNNVGNKEWLEGGEFGS